MMDMNLTMGRERGFPDTEKEKEKNLEKENQMDKGG